MARILVLGGGFAGITAVEVLAEGAGREHEISLVSAVRKFTFYPGLVPFVFGDIEPAELSMEMVEKLEHRGIRFIEAEILDIDAGSGKVRVAGNDIDGEIHFDHLLIAIGRRLATEKVPGFFEHAHHLLGIGPALKFKKAIGQFRGGSIVLGMCPDSFLPLPVLESSLALADRFASEIAAGSVSITTVFPQDLDRVLAGANLFRDIRKALSDKGVTLIEDFSIIEAEGDSITSADGRSFPHDLLMLVPPFRGQRPVKEMAAGGNSDGFAVVNASMQVEGLQKVYAAGDIIALEGPRFGYMAMRQAKIAATNMLVELSGEKPSLKYEHELAWILGERFTHPHFFHYGVWDETLHDFDEKALLGMAGTIRERYGRVHNSDPGTSQTSSSY